MKRRFSVEQIVAVLKQAELSAPVAELTRKLAISEQNHRKLLSSRRSLLRVRSSKVFTGPRSAL
jgi:hypothetical protein